MELWDLYDGKRQPLGRTHNRKNPMLPGENHVVVDVWTVNSAHEVLLTLRHPDKREYPNCWENTAGSVLAGETSRQGAVRELFEETGIPAAETELRFLGTFKEETAFVDTYVVRRDSAVSDLTMQDGETVGAKWVTLTELDRMIADGSLAYPVGKRLESVRTLFEEFVFAKQTIRAVYATEADISEWMKLVEEVADNFPGLEIADYTVILRKNIARKTALCIRLNGRIAGILLFSPKQGCLSCMAVHPQYRRRGLASALVAEMLRLMPAGNVTVTTFREGDEKGAAPRKIYEKFGFEPDELIYEFGYPVQRFILRRGKEEE